MMKNAKIWLVIAVVACVIGFYSGFFSLMIIGSGVNGSGCGSQCSSSSEVAAAIGLFFLGGAVFSAVYSVYLSWAKREQVPRLWINIMVTTVNLLVVLIAGLLFILLINMFM
ncbi:hypothetical protein [Yersinia frederiksenii]|uniref:hypothetical protein n=1 Tax=Yersinia frederiksenii TaxID=29484 RepID=UPI0011A18F3C|nr:hypothetical protein [Yersinia frederiksenii]